MQKQELDSVFKNKLESFEMPPDEASWNAINQQMNKKRWFKRSAYFSSVVLVLGAVSLFFLKDNVSNITQPIDSTQIHPSIVPSPGETNISKESTTTVTKTKASSTTSSSSKSKQIEEQEANSFVQSPTIDSTSIITTTPKADTTSAPKVVIVKKKKPVYIIQQDTIVKTDSVKVKKRVK